MIYKVTIRFYIKTFLLVVFVSILQPMKAQDSLRNKQQLFIIAKPADYFLSIGLQKAKEMVDIHLFVPDAVLDLRYAGNNNFIGKKIYPSLNSTYLRRQAATALAAVQQELISRGLTIKIFDAYRPYAATVMMWELIKDDRYAADPKKGSGHNRGIAVDLTIVDVKTKKELDMGTRFDNFSDTAHHNFTALPDTALKNRLLLKTIMVKNGFKALDTEWWHYALPNAKEYDLLDLSFKQLKKINKRRNRK